MAISWANKTLLAKYDIYMVGFSNIKQYIVGVGGIPVLVVNHGMKSSPVTYRYILKITVIPKLP